MILNSTKYKNPQRTILGAINFVFNGDTIILCDTALGIVNLTLLEIPNDQWNTTYKLYVADKSNNAGTNNITINAPVGYLINGATSLVISVNGGCALIRVTENKQYLASLTSGGGGSVSVINNQNPLTPPVTLTTNLDKLIVKGFQTTNFGNNVTLENAFISVDNSQIQFLQGNNLLIPNQWYNITDATYGNFNHNFNVYVPALTSNSISTFGIGEFYDADYQNYGDYSGIVGFAGQLGIWNTSLITPVNSVVIWNNLHYVNINGLNGTFAPPLDPDAWVLLPYTSINGYILVYDEITYGFKNKIYYRKDKFCNAVELFDYSPTENSFDKFPFGNYFYKSNKVLNSSYWDCCNTKVSVEVYDNILNFTELLWTTLANVNTCSSNNFLGTIRPLQWETGSISLKIISNNFTFCQGSSILQDCFISLNNFVSSGLSFRISGGTQILSNSSVGGVFSVLKTGGGVQNNNLIYSNCSISSSNGTENQNNINNSQLNIVNNSGLFRGNDISQESSVFINNIGVSGEFVFNTINFKSSISIQDISNSFGDGGTKGLGNTISDCQIDIDNFTGGMYGNSLNKVQIIIGIFSGTIALCEFQGESFITIKNMQNQTFTELNAKAFNYGSSGWLMPESYNGGVYTFGLANIKCTLDCADPLIYNAGFQSLTIPNELRKWGGIFTLTNANGIIISNIANTYDKAPYTFFNDNGSTGFKTTNVGLAVGNELISTNPPATFTINYRGSGSDYIVSNRSGLFMALTEITIFV